MAGWHWRNWNPLDDWPTEDDDGDSGGEQKGAWCWLVTWWVGGYDDRNEEITANWKKLWCTQQTTEKSTWLALLELALGLVRGNDWARAGASFGWAQNRSCRRTQRQAVCRLFQATPGPAFQSDRVATRLGKWPTGQTALHPSAGEHRFGGRGAKGGGEEVDLGVGCYDCGLLYRKDGNHPAQALSREQQIQRRRVGDFPVKQGVLQGCRRHERKCIERGVEFISHLPGVCWRIESSPVLQICFNEI